MHHILTIHESDIFPEKEDANSDSFRLRNAARAIVLNDKGEVALLKVGAHSYHKLPGGGVEADEDTPAALRRELLEEIGCAANITTEVGEIVEYRDRWQMKQVSHCYLTQQTGSQQAPNFTQGEIDEEFMVIWVQNIETAINLLENDEPKNYDGLFVQRRDSELLKTAQRIIFDR